MRILFQFTVRQAANFLRSLISKWGFETTHPSASSARTSQSWKGRRVLPPHPLCTVTPFAPYPADQSGLNLSANSFWIHLSSYLTYRENSTALKILLSNPSLLLPRLLFPQNQLFCFEVDRTGRKFYFCTCPSSCLSLKWVLHPPDTRWAPTLPPSPPTGVQGSPNHSKCPPLPPASPTPRPRLLHCNLFYHPADKWFPKSGLWPINSWWVSQNTEQKQK